MRGIATLDTAAGAQHGARMIVIPQAVLDDIVAAVRAAPQVEACGLLLGTDMRVTAALAAANVSATPEAAFEIDPARLLATLRAARGGGPALLGHYHSHPGGAPAPSPRDADAAAADGRLWLIVGAAQAGLWRATAAGAVHGRFDPAPWRLERAQGLQDMPAVFSY